MIFLEEEEQQDNNQQSSQGPVTTPIKNARHNIHCLAIIGQIEGHVILPPQSKTTKYEHVIPTLVSIEEDRDIEGLLIILNTVGGDVEAGLAIAEMIATMSKPTVSLVLGGGHSIGVPLAVASKYSYIVPSATMTIHPIRMNGLVIGASQTFDYFSKVQDRIITFVANNSHIGKEKILSLMLETKQVANDLGTILFGEEAVTNGLIDNTGGLTDALNKLYEMIELEASNKEKEEKAKPKNEAKVDAKEENAKPKNEAKVDAKKKKSKNKEEKK